MKILHLKRYIVSHFSAYCILLACCFSTTVVAKPRVNFSEFFTQKSGCFVLYDLTTDKTLVRYNKRQCATRISPCSTFKIPLALIAFDQGIFKNENTTIQWDRINREFADWNKDQTPTSWLRHSVIWVSQWLTPQIKIAELKRYLNNFEYGDQDISGGTTKFWLSSSLKISGNEQLHFLKRLWNNRLAASAFAINNTKKIIPSEVSEIGSTLYGKAGAGFINESNNKDGRIGWFVGYVSLNKHDYIFVTNFTDKIDSTTSGGSEAKEITKKILHELGLW